MLEEKNKNAVDLFPPLCGSKRPLNSIVRYFREGKILKQRRL